MAGVRQISRQSPLIPDLKKTTLVEPYFFFGGRCEEAIAFFLCLSLPDEDAAGKAFAALAKGGKASMPRCKTF